MLLKRVYVVGLAKECNEGRSRDLPVAPNGLYKAAEGSRMTLPVRRGHDDLRYDYESSSHGCVCSTWENMLTARGWLWLEYFAGPKAGLSVLSGGDDETVGAV